MKISWVLALALLSLSCLAGVNVGDYVNYKIRHHNDRKDSEVKFIIKDYDYLSDSYLMSVNVNGKKEINWIAGSDLANKARLNLIYLNCEQHLGLLEDVNLLNGETLSSCKNTGEDIIGSMPDFFINEYDMGGSVNNYWINTKIPIFGITRMIGKRLGALVSSYGYGSSSGTVSYTHLTLPTKA